MMNLVEEMIEKVAIDLHGTTKVKVGEHIIDFKRPWERYTMYEAISHLLVLTSLQWMKMI